MSTNQKPNREPRKQNKEPRKQNKEPRKQKKEQKKKEEILKLVGLDKSKIPSFLYAVQKNNNIRVGMVSPKYGDRGKIEYFCNQTKKNNPKYMNHKRWFWNKRYYEIVFSLQ